MASYHSTHADQWHSDLVEAGAPGGPRQGSADLTSQAYL